MGKINIINPFERIAGLQALLIGLGGILVSSIIGAVGFIHFDGVMDIHGGSDAPIWFYLSENLISWFCIALWLSIAAALFSSSKFRLVDIWGTLAFSRIALIPVAIYGACFSQKEVSESLLRIATQSQLPTTISISQWISFCIYILLSIATIIFMVVWMYQAFKVSSNLKGIKAVVLFIIAFLLAEISAKLMIHFVSQTL